MSPRVKYWLQNFGAAAGLIGGLWVASIVLVLVQ